MKAIVCGNLIDTELIYKIGEVFLDRRDEKMQFYIYFLNSNKLEIILPIDRDIVRKTLSNKSSYEAYGGIYIRSKEDADKYSVILKEYYDTVNSVRDELVKIWSKGQLDIPTIKFKEIEI